MKYGFIVEMIMLQFQKKKPLIRFKAQFNPNNTPETLYVKQKTANQYLRIFKAI